MSKKQLKISENVMRQIRQGKVVMHSKIYFVLGSFLSFLAIFFTAIFSLFFLSLIKFTLRSHGPMGQYRLEQMIANFPWWAIILAILSMVMGIKLLKKYDFSYKNHFWLAIAGFILALIAVGWLIDETKITDRLFSRGYMGGIMKRYINKDNTNSIPKGTVRGKYYMKGGEIY